ncbi:MAG TPA: hypothetical protein VGE97_10730, partial [Nitrososphaera sp.]
MADKALSSMEFAVAKVEDCSELLSSATSEAPANSVVDGVTEEPVPLLLIPALLLTSAAVSVVLVADPPSPVAGAPDEGSTSPVVGSPDEGSTSPVVGSPDDGSTSPVVDPVSPVVDPVSPVVDPVSPVV